MRVAPACITKQHGTQHRSPAVLHNSGRMSFFKTLCIETWMVKGFLIFAIKINEQLICSLEGFIILKRKIHDIEYVKTWYMAYMASLLVFWLRFVGFYANDRPLFHPNTCRRGEPFSLSLMCYFSNNQGSQLFSSTIGLPAISSDKANPTLNMVVKKMMRWKPRQSRANGPDAQQNSMGQGCRS